MSLYMITVHKFNTTITTNKQTDPLTHLYISADNQTIKTYNNKILNIHDQDHWRTHYSQFSIDEPANVPKVDPQPNGTDTGC